jgi:transposase
LALSMDLRTRIVAAHANGEGGLTMLSRRFKVSISTVQRLLRLQKLHGHVAPSDAPRGRKSTLIGEAQDQLRALVRAHPDAREDDLVEMLATEHDIQTSTSAVGRTLRKLGLTRKKRRSEPPKTTPKSESSDAQPS